MSILSDADLYLIAEGTHDRIYDKLGAHVVSAETGPGTRFAVLAPHARDVSVIGDFNRWNPSANPLNRQGGSGVWAGFVAGVKPGALYKYSIVGPEGGPRFDKADPYAFAAELRPGTSSRVFDLSGYAWGDDDWLLHRPARQSLSAPLAIYEVHLGSWMRVPEQGDRPLTYREAAVKLADYAAEMGFTHVELMPVGEHPADESWGYQMAGYFAATSRYGSPQDLMFLIDTLHQRGVGVILDWVPAHFARDAHGLGAFDGAPLYEYADPRKMIIPEWNTFAFNYESPQVVNFLIGNALFWLDAFHADGLRVDGVEPMLRLDFGRKPGEWAPNPSGGAENLEGVAFLQQFNRKVHAAHPGTLTIAEDPTPRPHVTGMADGDNLGFDLKWDLGWVHDTVDGYTVLDPEKRRDAHGKPVFRMHYAFDENYLLPLSHDEVKKGKGALLPRMPGNDWEKRANLRLLFGYMYALPGKKLLFMGDELGQWEEWSFRGSVDWRLLSNPRHLGLQRWVRDLNTQYRAEPALHELDCRREGFEWVDSQNAAQSVFSFLRKGSSAGDLSLVVCNFSRAVHRNYRIGVPRGGDWKEILNSDAEIYGGGGQGNMGGLTASPVGWQGRPHSVNMTVPPLGMIVLKSLPR